MNQDIIEENIGTIVYLSKDIEKVAELIDRYGEDVTLGGLFERLCADKKIAWKKIVTGDDTVAKSEIPEVGKTYTFINSQISDRPTLKVIHLYTKEESKEIKFPFDYGNYSGVVTLYEEWERYALYDGDYSDDTDYIVACEFEDYSTIYFARNKDLRWLSFEVNDFEQPLGYLDC